MQPTAIHTGRGIAGARRLEFDALPSTNTWALEHLDELAHGDVVFAACQTGGHGRLDREWVSPGNRGLAQSFILDPSCAGNAGAARLTQIAALAVRQLIAERNLAASLKWPNDVLVRGRKIAGILAEGRSDRALVVVGVGINVNLTANDLERRDWGGYTTSLLIETAHGSEIADLGAALTVHLERVLGTVRTSGADWLHSEWKLHDALSGRCIALRTASGVVEGDYAGISEAGNLLLSFGGRLEEFHSGDVSIGYSPHPANAVEPHRHVGG
jgi:BirA family transcriptional regulator, biotin operon repressor / biotin---[acetyl-CoA-carboxylase] ligase